MGGKIMKWIFDFQTIGVLILCISLAVNITFITIVACKYFDLRISKEFKEEIPWIELEKLGKFIRVFFPDDIVDGSAADTAISLLTELRYVRRELNK